MRRSPIWLSCAVMAASLMSAGAVAAQAETQYHQGYDPGTNTCSQCHALTLAAQDQSLAVALRASSTCNTCHGLFGRDAVGAQWVANAASTLAATGSGRVVYQTGFSGQPSIVLDSALGHLLNSVGLNSDNVPGGAASLRVADAYQPQIGAPKIKNYAAGVCCSTCHVSHFYSTNRYEESRGVMVKISVPGAADLDLMLLSSNFPHTIFTRKLLSMESDGICTLCHYAGSMP